MSAPPIELTDQHYIHNFTAKTTWDLYHTTYLQMVSTLHKQMRDMSYLMYKIDNVDRMMFLIMHHKIMNVVRTNGLQARDIKLFHHPNLKLINCYSFFYYNFDLTITDKENTIILVPTEPLKLYISEPLQYKINPVNEQYMEVSCTYTVPISNQWNTILTEITSQICTTTTTTSNDGANVND